MNLLRLTQVLQGTCILALAWSSGFNFHKILEVRRPDGLEALHWPFIVMPILFLLVAAIGLFQLVCTSRA